ncbi:GNAT family N-acetyltransferase [Spirochaeta isovalerica]|uniref:Putative acetyltransferase n=1 Tax=Spirochaeta isovalerica TaxID=150 RepID=A0A841RE49_9SPIO|nr:putative acetyltransferase [Spirochaeta isovalerica]
MDFSIYTSEQIEEIREMFVKTFTDSEGESEGRLIGDLTYDFMTSTKSEDLYGFVAMDDQKIVGGIFFSRLAFDNGTRAFIMAPVAVHTDFQGQGIGQKLIRYGLGKLKEEGIEIVVTYGDINFYSKVGFQKITEDIIKAPLKLSYPEGWLAQSLLGNQLHPISGRTYCVEELKKPEYW